jgi:pimeloyl-ACP methyl ester carboxylesterase
VADAVSHLQIHGWPDCSAGWRFQIPALLELGLRVVAPDLMGFGGTVSSSPFCCFMISHSALASLATTISRGRSVGAWAVHVGF